MKLEQQVTSLEISKRLKELGVKQESLFEYHLFDNVPSANPYLASSKYTGGKVQKGMTKYSTFTVAELGEILPEVICEEEVLGGYSYAQHIYHPSGIRKWGISYCQYQGEMKGDEIMEVSEADARGEMLIYLIENKLITI